MLRKILDSGKSSSQYNMSVDESLLLGLRDKESLVLHLYDWNHAIPVTHGYFVQPKKIFKEEKIATVDLARRSTGGGVVFHDGDFAFSLLVPASHPSFSTEILSNYRWVNSFVSEIIKKVFGMTTLLLEKEKEKASSGLDFCMAKISRYDVVIEDAKRCYRKIGGAAQRTTRFGFLHQGTIFLSRNSESFYHELLLPHIAEGLIQETCLQAFYPLGVECEYDILCEVKGDLKGSFIKEFSSTDLFDC